MSQDSAVQNMFDHLTDPQKHSFTQEFGIDENMDFPKVLKVHKVYHSKQSVTRGELLTVYALANKLGGYQIEACRNGALEYLKAAYEHCPALVTRNTWCNVIFVRYFEHISMTTTSEE
jgi:hypothetical protein